MKTIKSVLPKMIGFFLIMMVITSVIYPAVITAAANVAFGSKAQGSIITGNDGKKYGSALLAQEFTGSQYLWGRIMNVDTSTFTDENGETLEQVSITANSENSFNKTISIPKTDGSSIGVDVYTGDKPYGQFESWAYNYVKLVRDGNGGWVIEQSPVFEHNKAMYEKDKSIKEALKYTASIQSNSDSIISIAEQLTADKTTDYEKVLALHDWICSYMYYDVDSLASDEAPPYYATDIVKSRKAVCLGFATLMASLCRSIDIPCNVVSGYALGVGNDTAWTDISIATDEQNHAWNEVYVDGRWMIVDTTWDCANKIENGEMNKGEVSHLYFDANLQFFSNNHKILEYSKRR